jgi:hypothetical protein
MNTNDENKRAFPIAGIDTALRRAAIRAREVAKRTQTPVVIWQDGKIVEIRDESVKLDEFRREIGMGIKEADAGQVAPFDAKETLARVRNKRRSRKAP